MEIEKQYGIPRWALSIRQPWCWLILTGGKDVENRTWATGFRGRVLLHAAKLPATNAPVLAHELGKAGFPVPRDLPAGGVVGVVRITGCVTAHESPWFDGPYGFTLEEPAALPFVAVRGAVGFFRIPDSVRLALAGQQSPAAARTGDRPGTPRSATQLSW